MATGVKFSGVFLGLSLVLCWLMLVFNERVGMIYMFLVIATFIWYYFDNRITYEIEKSKEGRLQSLIIALISTGAFIVIGNFISKNVLGSAQSAIALMAEAQPVLQGNKALTLITWAVLITITESMFFFGRLYERLPEILAKRNIRVNTKHIKIATAIIISGLFAIFHLQSKGLYNNASLAVTFTFGLISCFLVYKFMHQRESILMHAVVNGLAISTTLGFLNI